MDLFDDTIIIVAENKRRFEALFNQDGTKNDTASSSTENEDSRRLRLEVEALKNENENLRREIVSRDDQNKHLIDQFKAENIALKQKLQDMKMQINQLKEGPTADPNSTRIVRFQLNNPTDECIRERYRRKGRYHDESADSSGTDSSGVTSVGSSGPDCQNCLRLKHKYEDEMHQQNEHFLAFQQLAKNFRQAVFLILGYKVKMIEDYIVVQLATDASLILKFSFQDGHYQLVNREALNDFQEETQKYLNDMDSFPHFFAALTLRNSV